MDIVLSWIKEGKRRKRIGRVGEEKKDRKEGKVKKGEGEKGGGQMRSFLLNPRAIKSAQIRLIEMTVVVVVRYKQNKSMCEFVVAAGMKTSAPKSRVSGAELCNCYYGQRNESICTDMEG